MPTPQIVPAAVPIEPIQVVTLSTTVISSVPIADVRSVKWVITITNLVGPNYKTSEVLALHDGVTATHTEYGIIGDDIDCTVDVTVSLGNMELQLTNNTAQTLYVNGIIVETRI